MKTITVHEELFFCENLKCKMLPVACADRQRVVSENRKIRTLNGKTSTYNIFYKIEACIGCKQGKKYRDLKRATKRKVNLKKSDRIKVKKIIKETTMVKPNTCEKCGEMYEVKPGEDGRAFRYRKLCYGCESETVDVPVAAEDKAPEKIPIKPVKAVKPEKRALDTPSSKTTDEARADSGVPEKGSENLPVSESTGYYPSSKFCEWKECGQEFFPNEGQSRGSWALRRFCCTECQQKDNSLRKKKRRAEVTRQMNPVGLDPAVISRGAVLHWNSIESLIDVLIDEVDGVNIERFEKLSIHGFEAGARFVAQKLGVTV